MKPAPNPLWLPRTLTLTLFVSACVNPPPPAQPAPDPQTWSFFSVSNDEIGFEGSPMAVQLTTDGMFNTGLGELDLGFGAGEVKAADPRVRQLRDGSIPIVSYSVERDGCRYSVESWAAPPQLDPRGDLLCYVRVVVRGTGEARVSARFIPWTPRPGRVEREDDEDWFIDRFLDEDTWSGPESFQRIGDTVWRNEHLVLVAPPGGVDEGPGRLAWHGAVDDEHPLSLVFTLPLIPVARQHEALVQQVTSSAPEDAEEAVVSYWTHRLAEGMTVDLPEPKVVNTFRASLAWLLIARDVTAGERVVQTVSENMFKKFYPRDASYMTRTYDMLGLHDTAFETLERFIVYGDDGLPARLERLQPDDWGQSLWAIGGHFEMTGDLDYAAWVYPVVGPHLDALEQATATDPLGLWPAAGPYDNEALTGHYVGHSFWVLLGLDEAARLARAVGDSHGQARAEDLRAAYLERFLTALAPRIAETGGYIPPGLEAAADGFDWANVGGGVYPFGVFASDDPRVTATLALVRPGRYREGLMTYGPNAWALAQGLASAPGDLHHYLTMYVTQTLLARDQQRSVVEDLYAVLAHTSSTHAGFERIIQPYGVADPGWDRTPHGWFAARYIELVRNMLVREDGDRLHLFSAVAPLWVAPGAHIAVQRAATRFGDIDLRLDASEGGATVTLSAAWSQAPKHLVVHAPWFVTLDGADTDIGTPQVQGNEVLVPPEATRVTLRWTRSEDEPDLSFATAIKILAAKRADPPTGLAARLLFTP